ncbi:collagen-binding domain-containing protein [Microbacterium sp. AZCO]|uniref:collagen-binding domain-containing protein n=1 Tax=Microbacterium sp. AZCO TaxID=3142976 RepID=UPI0031F35DBE
MGTDKTRLATVSGIAAVAVGIVTMTASIGASAAPGDTIGPFNPVTEPMGQQVDGHNANSDFLIFIENDVQLNADEAEGTLALGGDLLFGASYNVMSPRPTFTVPGESEFVSLYVGGGIDWTGGPTVLKVLGNGYAKVADGTTFDAFNRDTNNAAVNYQIVQPGAGYNSVPRIEGTSQQSPASIEAPVPAGLIDIGAAYTLYREASTTLGTCTQTVELQNRDDGTPLPRPILPGANARITLTTGQTNVLNLTTAELENLESVTFTTPPDANTPLLVNITGSGFVGTLPQSAGIGEPDARSILYNFVDATSVVVNGGDSLNGTIYAPRATVNWRSSSNISGNVIAANFVHGIPVIAPVGSPREVHDFPFSAELTCIAASDVTPTPTDTGTTTPTPTPTPTVTPTPTPTDPDEGGDEGGPTSTPSASTLPATGGADVSWFGFAAGIAVAAGGLIVLGDVARRRRS